MARDDLLVVGVMTGNSMDACDVVLTRFSHDGEIEDLATHSEPVTPDLYDALFALRTAVNEANGDMTKVAETFSFLQNDQSLSVQDVHDRYLEHVAGTIHGLIEKAHQDSALISRFGPDFEIDLIGNHGQNLAHYPPSIAGTSDMETVYTVQIGDGQQLADKIGIPVAFDFRSDDVMNGGEGAPLAPYHQKALAAYTRKMDCFPIIFCNSGNTGNVALITTEHQGEETLVMGWDTGPFNYFPDQIIRRETGEICDWDGKIATRGQLNMSLLQALFERAVRDDQGRNFLLRQPPRSSDGEWYHLLPELTGEAPVAGEILSLPDRVRTACYFVSYIYFHSLSFTPDNMVLPKHYVLCGGGWKHPLTKKYFEALVNGDEVTSPVLPSHAELFAQTRQRMQAAPGDDTPTVRWSDDYGFDGTAMEARLFAHLAVNRIRQEPFTHPASTGCHTPTVCGILRYPGGDSSQHSARLGTWMETYHINMAATSEPAEHDSRWSRAVAGWATRGSHETSAKVAV